jgi:hypothetical protein
VPSLTRLLPSHVRGVLPTPARLNVPWRGTHNLASSKRNGHFRHNGIVRRGLHSRGERGAKLPYIVYGRLQRWWHLARSHGCMRAPAVRVPRCRPLRRITSHVVRCLCGSRQLGKQTVVGHKLMVDHCREINLYHSNPIPPLVANRLIFAFCLARAVCTFVARACRSPRKWVGLPAGSGQRGRP